VVSKRTISWDVSTATLPDAFERYIVGMADIYEVSGVSQIDRRQFFNTTETTMCASGAVGWGRSVRQTLSRGPEMLRRSEVDGLNLLINGTAMVGDADGRAIQAAPGALQFRDMGRLAASRIDCVDVKTMLIPRNLAPAALLAPGMHGLVLPPEMPAVRLLAAHMQALLQTAEDLSEPELDAAMQALMMIAAKAAGADLAIEGQVVVALQSTVRRTAVEFIERRLQAMQLPIDIDAVASAGGVSRATLYRAFDGEGGVNTYIQDRRLHHARSALRRRNAASPTVAHISEEFGFASSSHFSRLFRARYGYSPSEVEPPRAPRDLSMSAGPIRHDLLGDWLTKLKLGQDAVA
jgi:AraC-like DNA-binding protein